MCLDSSDFKQFLQNVISDNLEGKDVSKSLEILNSEETKDIVLNGVKEVNGRILRELKDLYPICSEEELVDYMIETCFKNIQQNLDAVKQ